jgi:hypothetical protein
MIEALQVHQLMDQHVIANRRRHQDESPVQRDLAVTATGSPSRALITDAHAGHGQAVFNSDLQQPCWQLRARALAKRHALPGAEHRWHEPRPLPRDPVGVTLHERVGLALRSAARDRHAYAPVMIDTQEIPSRTAMTNEIDRCKGAIAGRCYRAIDRRRKRTYACRCDRALTGPCARIVNERQTELHARQDTRTIRTLRTTRTIRTIY